MSLKNRINHIKDAVSFTGEKPASISREAVFPAAPGADPDEHLWEAFAGKGGLRRTRNLPKLTQQQMLEMSHYFYKGNPIAKRIIEITPEYVVGEGVGIVAEDEAVKEVLDAHWTNQVNRWSIGAFERIRELGLVGELCIPVSVNKENGHVELGNIDPGLIDAIMSEKDNAMQQEAVILKKMQGEDERRAYKIISLAHVPLDSKASGRLVGLPETEEQKAEFGFEFMKGDTFIPHGTSVKDTAKWVGSCFFFTVNNPISAERGWSDLLQNMDWIDAHDQFLFSQVEKGIESAKYVWDVELRGMNDQQIAEWLGKQAPLKPGVRHAHNENVSMDAKAPNLHLEDATTLAGALKNHILAGSGLPPIWFAESLTSRASAPEMTEPTFKHLKMRQKYAAYIITFILRFVIDSAILARRLVQDKRRSQRTQAGIESTAFYIELPDISAKDQRLLATALMNIAGALGSAVESGFLSKERAQRVFDRYLDLNGLDETRDEPKFLRGADTIPNEEFNPSSMFKKLSESGKIYSRDGVSFYLSRDPQLSTGTHVREVIKEAREAREMKEVEMNSLNGKVSKEVLTEEIPIR